MTISHTHPNENAQAQTRNIDRNLPQKLGLVRVQSLGISTWDNNAKMLDRFPQKPTRDACLVCSPHTEILPHSLHL